MKKVVRIINDANDGLGVRCGMDNNLSVAVVSGEYGCCDTVLTRNFESK